VVRFLAVFVFLVSAMSLMTACGGSGGASDYDDPSEEYYSDVNTLLSVAQLKQWVDNGCMTEDGKPVLVIDFGPGDYDNDTKTDFIPCSVNYSFANFLDTRSDGPAKNYAMVASATKMESNLQKLGITKDTVVVFTAYIPKNPAYVVTRPWWTFYYWGFPESQIKILNGGSRFWYSNGYEMTNVEKLVSPSNFKISDLPYPEKRVARIDEARAPIGKMIKYAKNGGALILATVDGTAVIKEEIDTYFGFYSGFIKGAKDVTGIWKSFLNDDGTFKSAEEILDLFASKGVDLRKVDKNTRIIPYCNKGVLASYYYYVLKEVLGFNNVGTYDGSWTEWSGLFYDETTGLGTVNPHSNYNAYDLTDNASLSSYATPENINAYISDREVMPNYDGPGDEINTEDKALILNSIENNSGSGSEAFSPVGSGGC